MRRIGAIVTLGLVLLPALARAQDPDGLPPPSPLGNVTTGFSPSADAPPFRNAGNYVNARGTCFGDSAVAIANFRARKKGDAKKLTGVEAEAQTVAAQIDYQDRLSVLSYRLAYAGAMRPATDVAPGTKLHGLLQTSGPQIVVIQWMGWNHAIVVFGYEAGSFLVYDSEFPDRTLHFPFDKVKGFGKLEEYGVPARVIVVPESDAFVDRAARLRDPCRSLDGTCAATFWKVEPTLLRTATKVTAKGTISGGREPGFGLGIAPVETVVASVNGQVVGKATVKDKAFTMDLPADVKGPIRFFALTGYGGPNGRQLAGFSTKTFDAPKASGTAAPATSGIAAVVSIAH